MRPFNSLTPWRKCEIQPHGVSARYNPRLAERCELYNQIIVSGYVRLARYVTQGATQSEAELCVASQTLVEYGIRRLYFL